MKGLGSGWCGWESRSGGGCGGNVCRESHGWSHGDAPAEPAPPQVCGIQVGAWGGASQDGFGICWRVHGLLRPSCVPQKGSAPCAVGTAGMWIPWRRCSEGHSHSPLCSSGFACAASRLLPGLRQLFGKSFAGSSHRSTKQHQDSREALLEPFPWEQKALEALPAGQSRWCGAAQTLQAGK